MANTITLYSGSLGCSMELDCVHYIDYYASWPSKIKLCEDTSFNCSVSWGDGCWGIWLEVVGRNCRSALSLCSKCGVPWNRLGYLSLEGHCLMLILGISVHAGTVEHLMSNYWLLCLAANIRHKCHTIILQVYQQTVDGLNAWRLCRHELLNCICSETFLPCLPQQSQWKRYCIIHRKSVGWSWSLGVWDICLKLACRALGGIVLRTVVFEGY